MSLSKRVPLLLLPGIKILVAALGVCLLLLCVQAHRAYQPIQGKWELLEIRGKSGDEVLVKPAPEGLGFWIIGNWIRPIGASCEQWGMGALLFLNGNPRLQVSEGNMLPLYSEGLSRSTPILMTFEGNKLLIAIRGGAQHPKTLDLQTAPDGVKVWVLRRAH